jgi:hypothetical protein
VIRRKERWSGAGTISATAPVAGDPGFAHGSRRRTAMGDWRDTKWAFMDGQFVPIENAAVNIRTSFLHYGTGVFEGIRAYWSDKRGTLCIFRAREHYERMIRNARIIAMEIPYTSQELVSTTKELLKKEAFRENT